VLPSGVENEQCLQHLIGRTFYRLFHKGAAYVNFFASDNWLLMCVITLSHTAFILAVNIRCDHQPPLWRHMLEIQLMIEQDGQCYNPSQVR